MLQLRMLLLLLASLLVGGLVVADDKKADEPKKDAKEITNSIGMKLVWIPAGKFTMGSPKDEKYRYQDEQQCEVEITKSFYMGVYTVTQAENQHIMGTNPSAHSANGYLKEEVAKLDASRFPVEMVSWHQAVEFCDKLSKLPKEKAAGYVYRLPTEAEWEYACRAGTTTPFHFGKSLSSTQANIGSSYPDANTDKGPARGRPKNVGSYEPNAFGLYDMHGNVWQWCQDWYVKEYPGGKDPVVTIEPAHYEKVVRGGYCSGNGAQCRSARRFQCQPMNQFPTIGFRVVAVQAEH